MWLCWGSIGIVVPFENKFSMELLSVKQLKIPELYHKDLSDIKWRLGEGTALNTHKKECGDQLQE